MKRALLTLVYLFITGMLISAQECPPGEAQIDLLTDRNQVAIYVPEGTISLKGINIETIFEGQPARFFLESYPDFDALNLDSLTGPHCLYLLAGDSPLVTPSQCTNLGPDQETVQRISADQNFWYDVGAGIWGNLSIMQFAYNLGVCNNPSAPCVITIPPLAVPVPSSGLCSNPILCELFLDTSIIEGAQSFAFTENNGTLSDLLTPQCAYWGDYGLQIDFNMPPDPNGGQGGFGGWGVHWDFASNGSFDAAKYEFLTFWLKTDIDANFQIGIKDTSDRQTKIELQDWAQVDNWQLFRVPLSRFANDGVDLSQIKDINFGFNSTHGQGSVCIDNIAFLQEAVTIDNGSTVNTRIEPHTTCDVLNQLNSNELFYIAAENIPGTDVGGNSDWVLAIYQGQYVYLHNSLVIVPEDRGIIIDGGPPPLTIADFESGTNINNLGEEIGAFYPEGTGDDVVVEYINGLVNVNYTLATNSYGGYWVKLGGADFSPYSQLAFDITASASFSIKLELKHTGGGFAFQYIPVGPSRQTVTIDLEDLSLTDFSSMNELVFVLEQSRVGSNGIITIDNITLR